MKININNDIVLIDKDDYSKFKKYSWTINKLGRNRSIFYVKILKNKKGNFLLHRLIMNAKPGEIIDHINHNGLDNRKKNLRICSQSENMRNSRKYSVKTSEYVGVSWDKDRNKWVAQISINGMTQKIGRYKTDVEAAKAYDKKLSKLKLEYCKYNFNNFAV